MGVDRLVEVGRELRRLRVAAGLSGVELARRAGVPQPTVSRVETGRRISDVEVVIQLLGALGLEEAEFERLAGAVREAYGERVPRRVDAGVSFRRGAAVELERSAMVVRSFESVVIPGVLRTADYVQAAKPVSAGDGVDRGAVLADEGRRFTFVMAEAVLRTWPGPGEFMPEQLDRLLAVSERGHVRLGVVPAGTAVESEHAGMPLHGFTVYDESAVTVETFTRELTLTGDRDVRAYLEIFKGFERAAVYGDEARELVRRARRDLVRMLPSIQ